MRKLLFIALALASLLPTFHRARAAVITEDFSSDPLQHGWNVIGDTNLFRWDSTNHVLSATWDSERPTTFLYYGLDGYLTRYDDFTFQFDLFLTDIASDIPPGKTGPLQIALGFQNYSVATNADYYRAFGGVSDIAEFNYFPHGFYDFGVFGYFDSPPKTQPAFVSHDAAFSPVNLNPDYVLQLPTNLTVHVIISYSADNQTATLEVTTNGVPVGILPPLILNGPNSNFTNSDDYTVNMFSITSYTSIGDDYDSVLAHGTVANLQITLPPPAQNLLVGLTNGSWGVTFNDKTNWLYTLQRTTDLVSWSDASGPLPGNGTALTVQDTNAPSSQAFYRVRAIRP